MPVPYIVSGDRDQMRESLSQVADLSLDNIIQGHGDVLLRGEILEAIETSNLYLDAIEEKVQLAVSRGQSRESLRSISIEECHKSRIPLNGLVEELHQSNLAYLYDMLTVGAPPGPITTA